MTKTVIYARSVNLLQSQAHPVNLLTREYCLVLTPLENWKNINNPKDISHLFSSTQTIDQNQFNLCGPSFLQLLAMK